MQHYDIIIIGTGAGGGTLAQALAPTGKKILLIERGDFLPREQQNWSPKSVFVEGRYTTDEQWIDKKGKKFTPGMHYFVGGNTKMYGACLFRLRESDFGEIEHYGGTSPAWPIEYAEMQPFYQQAEELFSVHGNRGEDPTEPHEAAPYPFPAMKHEDRVQGIFDGMKSMGLKPFHLPLGLQRNEENPEESKCIRCETCDGFPCMLHAKSDAHICGVAPALHHENVKLVTNTKALRFESDGKRVTHVVVEHEGSETKLSADTFVSSCGAINSAALLLRSGIANSSGLVGKNYMCHHNTAMLAISREKNRTVFQKTLGLNDFYHGSDDSELPLGHAQLLGNVKTDMLRGGAPPFTPTVMLEAMANYTVGWWLTSEDLPSKENYVSVWKDGSIGLTYTPNNLKGHDKLVKKMKKIIKNVDQGNGIGAPSIFISKLIPIEGCAHQVGTCVFGTDPKTSVLDLNCKAHDLDNLYVVDGSFFPSVGAVNPALTIIANALRVSEHLKGL